MNNRFLKLATNIALQSPAKNYKIGCVVTYKSNIISYAWNEPKKSHPLMASYAKRAGYPKIIYLHAEISALLKCGENLGDTIYVVRITKSGKLSMAKPCPVCELAIKEFGIKRVYFSNPNGEIEMFNID